MTCQSNMVVISNIGNANPNDQYFVLGFRSAVGTIRSYQLKPASILRTS